MATRSLEVTRIASRSVLELDGSYFQVWSLMVEQLSERRHAKSRAVDSR
jgi:hypothetical protein